MKPKTEQFTARIDARIMQKIRQQAQRKEVSINDELNHWLYTALVAMVDRAKQKQAGTANTDLSATHPTHKS